MKTNALMLSLALLALIALSTPKVSQAQSLLYHYSFDSGSLMEVGGAHTLTPNGGVSSSADRFGAVGDAYAVDGTSFSYLTSPVLGGPTVDSAFTIAAWVFTNSSSLDQKIFGHFDGPAFSGPLMGINAGSLDGEIVGSSQTRLTMGTMPASTWTHVAITWELGGSFTGYINGVSVGSVPAMTSTVPAGFSGTENHIGSAPWDPNFFVLNGNVDEIRMYDYALSDSAVAALACPASLSTLGIALGITATSADLSWVSGGGMYYTVEYDTAGFALGNGTQVVTTTNSLTVTGLDPETDYDFYVSDSCAAQSSPYAGPFTWTTLASPCDDPTAIATSADATSATISWMTAPLADLEYGLSGFTLGSGTTVAGITSPYVLTGLTAGENYDIYLRQDCDSGSVSSWVGPTSFSTSDTCLAPTAGAVSGETNVGATISWTDAAGSTATDLEWGPALYTPGSGTLVPSVTSPYALMGLSPGTSYDVYLRHLCNTDESAWEGPLNLMTVSLGLDFPGASENPFEEALSISQQSSSNAIQLLWMGTETISVQLYDLNGRLIESTLLEPGASASLQPTEQGYFMISVLGVTSGLKAVYRLVF